MILASVGARRRNAGPPSDALTERRQIATTSALQVGTIYVPTGMQDMTYRHTATIAADCTALVFSVGGENKTFTGRLGVRIGGALHHVLWGGVDGFSVSGATPAASDPLDVTLTVGAQIVVSYHLDNMEGVSQHPAAKASVGSNAAYGIGDLIDSDTGWTTTTHTGYLPIPSTITALTYPAAPAVVICGDSIGESGPGFSPGVRAAGVACSNFARWAGSYPATGDGGYTSLAEFTHALCEYGFNDLTNDATVATTMADALAFWAWLHGRNASLRITQTTITPGSTSTDGWTTLEGQTPMTANTGSDGSTRFQRFVAFNGWIRDGAPILAGVAAPGTTNPAALRAGDTGHPLAGWLEVADAVESSRDSGKLRVDLGALTNDGAHLWGAADLIATVVQAWAESLTA